MNQRIAPIIGIAALTLTLWGCSKPEPRTNLSKERISITALDGWSQTRQRNTAVFHDPKSRATIAVRAVPFNGPAAGERDLSKVVASTHLVLNRLPGAKLTRSVPLKRELFEAQLFDVTFQPKGKRTRYQRRHAVFIGEEAIYHLWLTAPHGQLERKAKLFDRVLDSLREEV